MPLSAYQRQIIFTLTASATACGQGKRYDSDNDCYYISHNILSYYFRYFSAIIVQR
jgi:hypothetical protein